MMLNLWASLVAQLVKKPRAMQEILVRFLGWEDPLEKGKATHSSVLATDSIVHGVAKSWTRLSHFHFSLSIFEDLLHRIESVQFSSVTQSCPTLCYPMNGSRPGLPVHHQLPEFTQTHVH